MSSPYSFLISRISDRILSAEKIKLDLFRISIEQYNFLNVMKIIRELNYQLRGISIHDIDRSNGNSIELQYILSTIFDARDFQVIICMSIKSEKEHYKLDSLVSYFPNADIFENKILMHEKIVFNPINRENEKIMKTRNI
ncbi:MAG: hypothetical protein ACFFD1_05920 [Candidatus Thorarchaeota archaeon]